MITGPHLYNTLPRAHGKLLSSASRCSCSARSGNSSMSAVPKQPSSSLTLAFDFGTDSSGFSSCASAGQVRCQSLYPGQKQPYCKTKTALLYSRDSWTAAAWGWEAYNQYTTLPKAQQQDFCYITKFKLTLASEVDVQSCTALAQMPALDTDAETSALPPELNPKQVITDYLRFLGQHGFKKLAEQWGSFKQDDVAVVLSVPAAWSDSAKQIMRQAAVDAGLVKSGNVGSLMLVHEPEAAALTVLKEVQDPIAMSEGDTFVVVDAGGGTVDITCHMVERKKGQLVLTEETHREGVLAGSTYLNTMIEQHICNRLGSTVYNDWKEAKPVDAVKLIYDRVELQKRSFDGASPIKLEMPLSLLRVIPSEVTEKLYEEQDGVDDELIISVEDSCEMFDRLQDMIIGATQKVLDRVNGTCDYMLIVGGFGESTYLVEKLREAFADSVVHRIVSPDVPSQAVLKGAAMYALEPDAIFARRSRHAYGIESSTAFKKGLRQDLRYTEPSSNKVLCKKIFSSLVQLDELVEHDQVKVGKFVAVYKHQAAVSFNLYACSNNSDRYVDAETMKKVGAFTLNIADPNKVTDPDAYKFTVNFRLGGSELTATAIDDQTNLEVQTTIIFVAE